MQTYFVNKFFELSWFGGSFARSRHFLRKGEIELKRVRATFVCRSTVRLFSYEVCWCDGTTFLRCCHCIDRCG